MAEQRVHKAMRTRRRSCSARKLHGGSNLLSELKVQLEHHLIFHRGSTSPPATSTPTAAVMANPPKKPNWTDNNVKHAIAWVKNNVTLRSQLSPRSPTQTQVEGQARNKANYIVLEQAIRQEQARFPEKRKANQASLSEQEVAFADAGKNAIDGFVRGCRAAYYKDTDVRVYLPPLTPSLQAKSNRLRNRHRLQREHRSTHQQEHRSTRQRLHNSQPQLWSLFCCSSCRD